MGKRKSILVVILTVLLGVSGVAYAHFSADASQPVSHTESVNDSSKTDMKKSQDKAVQGAQTETAPPPLSDNCTKTTSKSETDEDGNVSNTEHTEVNCKTEDDSNSTINVSNSTSQSAHSGNSSSGQSGNSSNKSETHVFINGQEQ